MLSPVAIKNGVCPHSCCSSALTEHGRCLAMSEKAVINTGSYGDYYHLQYFLWITC